MPDAVVDWRSIMVPVILIYTYEREREREKLVIIAANCKRRDGW